MKRLLSLSMSLLLVFFCTLSGSPAAAAQGATLLFDMDLSSCSVGSEPTVKDKSSSKAVNVINVEARSVTAASPKSDRPIYKEETVDGLQDSIKYLRFAYKDATNALANRFSQVNVQFKDSSIANSDAITVEVWARVSSQDTNESGSQQWGSMFSFGPGYLNYPGNDAFQFRSLGGNYLMYPDRKAVENQNANLGSTAAHRDKWTHYVVTREWKDGAWYSSLYINGKTTKTQKNVSSGIASKTNYEDKYAWLAIGGTAGTDSERAFIGDISSFRIYNGVMTESEIELAYAQELKNFYSLASAAHDLDKLTAETAEFTVRFDKAVNAATVNDDIRIITESESVIGTKLVNYDADTRSAKIKILDYLDAGGKYTLCLDSVRDPSGFPLSQVRIPFTAKTPENDVVISSSATSLTDQLGAVVTGISEAANASVSITVSNNASAPKTVALAMVVYQDGRLVKMIRSADTSVASGASDVPLSVSTETAGVTIGAGCKIKAIAWSVEQDTGAIAFSNPIEIQ